MRKIKNVFKDVYSIVIKPEMKVLPGQVAFFVVMSIIPSITLIGLLCSTFRVPFTNIINVINGVLPNGVGEILISFIIRENLSITIGASMIAGFILASNGPYSIIVTSNILYGIPQSSYLKRRIKALFLTILLLLLVIFSLIGLAFGNNIIHFIFNLKIFSFISKGAYYIYRLLKWPIGLFVIWLIIKLIYTMTPNGSIPSKYTNKGSLFTTVVWAIVTLGYSCYVNMVDTYNIFYGSLANIILLMLWIYILSYVLVFGMAINVNDYNKALNKK